MNDIFIEDKIEPGARLQVKKRTSSFKEGSLIKVKGFLEGDENKIVAEGALPGSWINRYDLKVSRRIKEGLRIKNATEIILEFGLDFPNKIPNGISNVVYRILGNMIFAEGIAKMTNKTMLYESKEGVTINLSREWLTFNREIHKICDWSLHIKREGIKNSDLNDEIRKIIDNDLIRYSKLTNLGLTIIPKVPGERELFKFLIDLSEIGTLTLELQGSFLSIPIGNLIIRATIKKIPPGSREGIEQYNVELSVPYINNTIAILKKELPF